MLFTSATSRMQSDHISYTSNNVRTFPDYIIMVHCHPVSLRSYTLTVVCVWVCGKIESQTSLLTMRVSYTGGAGFGGGGCHHHVHEVGRLSCSLVLLVHASSCSGLQDAPFDALVDHKVDDRLRDPGVGRGHAAVKPAKSICLIHTAHALQCTHPPLATAPERGNTPRNKSNGTLFSSKHNAQK